MNDQTGLSDKNVTLLVEELVALIEDIIYSKKLPETFPELVNKNERLRQIILDLLEMRRFLFAVSNGDLSVKYNLKGYMGGAIKTLQANLKHLTWQTQMIASGDLTQRVDFMGEFSIAFNQMVNKLDETMKSLKQKEAELMEINDMLTKEIQSRKLIESSLRESEKRYKSLSQIDSLTGIYNRRQFFLLAEKELKKAYRYKRPLSVLMLDLDFFKKINDTYGHAAGDKVLQMTAQIVTQNLRSVDIFGRYGGEEFVIMLPETNVTGALKVAERIRGHIEKTPFEIENNVIINITVSIGVCCEPSEKADMKMLDKIIDCADKALYRAKRLGRNRVCLYSMGEMGSGLES